MTDIAKNDNIDVTISSFGYRGEGVARISGMPVFIKGALPGERVRAHVILVKKDFAAAKLLEVLSPCADRAVPSCPLFGKCGGCDLMHLAYPAQLRFKRDAVRDALHKIARLDPCVSDCVPSVNVLGCRNKLSLPVRASAAGKAEVGLFAYNSHRVIPIYDCPLQTKRIRALLPALHSFANRFAPYDEASGKGELRHFVLREFGGRLSVTFVMTRDISGRVLRSAKDSDINADELWININPDRTNVIMGRETHLLGGKHEDAVITLGGRSLPVSVHPNAFYQVNDDIAAKLYSAVRGIAAAEKLDAIIDAYSGGGLMTALLSDCAPSVIGVEIEPAASSAADELMKKAGIKNVRNILGDCAKEIPGLVGDCGENTLIVLDPPRSGCAEEVTEAVNASRARSVIYISCDPATLARDISRMPAYTISSVTPFDMFPQTRHVETLVVLRRKR